MTTSPHHTFTPSPWRRHFVHCPLLQLLAALIAAVASLRAADRVSAQVASNAFLRLSKIAPWVMEHTSWSASRIFRRAWLIRPT
jgi:hypothetical protein